MFITEVTELNGKINQSLLHRLMPIIPAFWEAEIGEWQVQDQSEEFSNLARPCFKFKNKFKNKNKKCQGCSSVKQF